MATTTPFPEAGQVIRYSYLWQADAERGLEEGNKDRPCAVILVILQPGKRPLVRVLPVTHSPPRDMEGAIELPQQTKRRLGLDEQPSWVMLDEANDFRWPGPDLRPLVAGDMSTVVYGKLPPGFMKVLADRLVERRKRLRGKVVQRTE